MKKRRLLFVRPTMGVGGADRVTLNLMQNLSRADFQIELALMQAKGELLDDVPADVLVHNCNARSLWFMVSPLAAILKKGNYDIVYATCGGASIPLMLAKKMIHYKPVVVVSERNILVHPGKNQLKRKLMNNLKRWLYASADWVTVVSRELSSEVQNLLAVPETKIKVVNNPVVDDTLLYQKDLELDHPLFEKGKKVILAVGRLVHQKDYPTLLKAFQLLPAREQVHLLILGKGPLESVLQQICVELQIESSVSFEGYKKNPFNYMANCDIFVLSSLHEGMPGVLVQAMACGAVCVSTDCPTGPKEIIKNNENGFLVPVGDANKLADRIQQLLIDDSLRKQFSTSAPSAVSRYHTRDAINSYFDFL